MKRFAGLFFIMVIVNLATANACLNLYVVDEHGRTHNYNQYHPTDIDIHPATDVNSLKIIAGRLTTAMPGQNHQDRSDYAAFLIKLGRNNEALVILKQLFLEKPNEYNIVANLAVSYELDGQLDTALVLLKKAMQIKPNAHERSEWFHLQFLEAAIANRDHKEPVPGLSILTLPKRDTLQIGYEIAYQLQERLPLTPAPDQLLSKVMEESGDYFRSNISLELAIELYAMAAGYSADTMVGSRLWSKIETARSRLIRLRPKGSKLTKSMSYLYTSNWKEKLKQVTAFWAGYKPYRYEGEVRTDFR